MKAAVLHEYGPPKNLKYEDMPDPVPAEGEVLVRIAAASINPIDCKMRSGEAKENFSVEFPAILGRDLAGIVHEIGPGVTGFAPGDKVIALTWKTYAERAVVPASELTLLPEGLDLAESAALPLVTLTGEQLITRGVQIQSGQTVLVTGAAGGVGRSAVWTAKKAGAIVIAGVHKSQLKEAAGIGADEIIALDDSAAMQKLGFLDAFADTIGHETAEKLLGKVKSGGTFASVLNVSSYAKLNPTLRIVYVRSVPDAASLRILAEDVAAGHLKIPIDRMLPLDEAAAGQAAVEKGGIGKVLLLA
ncbi:NADP-dependent oxidoreductase [Granulicella sp. dw_53]|uniref:NADP-dependent oxidoreductase n=1 Tax=Granulicella sp. dw_53 TaxID=2719792 RepID=UPI001BD56035|nr:NADP-dependent oxidoreductase [Granulicella sp. dw_53]